MQHLPGKNLSVEVQHLPVKLVVASAGMKEIELERRLLQSARYSRIFCISDVVCRSSSACTEVLVRACRDTECLSANKHTDQSEAASFCGLSISVGR